MPQDLARPKMVYAGILALLCLLLSTQAKAGGSATINIATTIMETCTISATPLQFAAYSGLRNIDGSARVTVTCAGGAEDFDITVGPGSSENDANRTMKMEGSDATLNYQLYRDIGRQNALSGTNAEQARSGTLVHLDLYGRIPSGQSGPVGSYTDEVTVTLEVL